MRKIRCQFCGEIFEVEDDAVNIYCPKCFKYMSSSSGQKNLGVYVSKAFNQATIDLYESTEYLKARNNFQAVLDIIPNDKDAAEGLVLSTLLSSTLRKPLIKESLNELIRYQDALKIGQISIDRASSFIVKINDYLDLYTKTLRERLFDKDHFFEEKGKNLYLEAVKDVSLYKSMLIELYLKERILPTKFHLTKEDLENQIYILKLEEKANYTVESNLLHQLDSDVKEIRIDDIVFKDNRKAYKNRHISLIMAIISIAIFVTGIILIFLMPNRLLIGVPTLLIGLLLSFIFVIIDIFNKKKLLR